MTETLRGYLKLGCAIAIFAGWCLISTLHEQRMEMRLEAAREELRARDAERELAIRSLEAAHKAKEMVEHEYMERSRALAQALGDHGDWSRIDIPDDIRARMCGEEPAYNFCAPAGADGPNSDPGQGGPGHGRRHGAADN